MAERKVEKKLLSDRFLARLQPRSKRYTVLDTDVRGFGIRINRNGSKTFLLTKRFPGAVHPTARKLGSTDELSLAEAREKARSWNKLIARGVDPRREEQRRAGNTFGAILEDYIQKRLKGQRKAEQAEREIRKELLPKWEAKPIGDISRADVLRVIDEIVGRGAKRQAHNVFGHMRTFFNWAVAKGLIEHSTCYNIKPRNLIGAKVSRTRVLSDIEIAALWKAAIELGYPFGDLFRFLILTGAREMEAAGAGWNEFNLPKRLWTIPEARFKSGAQHIVPLSDEALMLLADLPRHNAGSFLFSIDAGISPVHHFDRPKRHLTAKMEGELGPVPNFQIHDLRRTVRTKLAELRVPDAVAEMVIGHARRGIQRVYDQHSYLDEIREALEAWSKRLRNIVEGRRLMADRGADSPS